MLNKHGKVVNMMKDLIKVVIILSVIAIIAGVLLGGVYVLTKVNADDQLNKKVKELFPEYEIIEKLTLQSDFDSKIPQEISTKGSIKNVFKTNDNTYIFHTSGKGGYGGEIELLIAIKDNKINKILVYSASETPGVGSRVLEGKYINQFINVDITAFEGFKLSKAAAGDIKNYFDGATSSDNTEVTGSADRNVVAVSGATRTSNAVLNAVNCAVYAYISIIG
jgi:electron transport complex protein RnfG